MSRFELEQILRETGLSENEAAVYLIAIEIGSNPASVIAKAAKINRSTVYGTLEQLIKKGLVTYYTKNEINYYNSEDPVRIIKYLEREKNLIEERLLTLKERITDFEKITKSEINPPKVILAEGDQNVRNIYYEIGKTDNKEKAVYENHLSEITVYDQKVVIISKAEKWYILIKNWRVAETVKLLINKQNGKYKSSVIVPRKAS